jgi:cysteinyl-tRNA synthetase
MFRFFNSATRRVEEFVPKKKSIGIYSCGPTVYHYVHIGNMRSFLLSDVLRRSLAYGGYTVKQVMNITDVGHLVSDADEGEDKMEKAVRREGKTAWDIAAFYTDAFLADCKRLNLFAPSKMPRATDHIKEQIALIIALEKGGHVYRIKDGMYFDTATFPGYGKLSGQKLEDKQGGKRIGIAGKRNASDFALWKFSNGVKREMEWQSPWGVGFPGWHIECSAMSRKYLGQPFDIHTGGIDHLPVHHENEIAQSEAAYGVPLARFWIHGEFLVLADGEKISKSKDNFLTLQTLIDKGYDPLAFRLFCFSAHYRKPLTFSWQAMDGAQHALQNLRQTVRAWDKPKGSCAEFEKRFGAAIENDLDMPKAMAVVWEMVKADIPTAAKAAALLHCDAVLGLGLKKYIAKPEKKVKPSAAATQLLKQRLLARANKDWKESDRLRDALRKLGWDVLDGKDGAMTLVKRGT